MTFTTLPTTSTTNLPAPQSQTGEANNTPTQKFKASQQQLKLRPSTDQAAAGNEKINGCLSLYDDSGQPSKPPKKSEIKPGEFHTRGISPPKLPPNTQPIPGKLNRHEESTLENSRTISWARNVIHAAESMDELSDVAKTVLEYRLSKQLKLSTSQERHMQSQLTSKEKSITKEVSHPPKTERNDRLTKPRKGSGGDSGPSKNDDRIPRPIGVLKSIHEDRVLKTPEKPVMDENEWKKKLDNINSQWFGKKNGRQKVLDECRAKAATLFKNYITSFQNKFNSMTTTNTSSQGELDHVLVVAKNVKSHYFSRVIKAFNRDMKITNPKTPLEIINRLNDHTQAFENFINASVREFY